ncbi:MAG: ribosomal-processing cysteine protease Prp [Clostridia bacterium]|nr:ribosomal-processing cysteine protease Prp [Clostridia bacterium]
MTRVTFTKGENLPYERIQTEGHSGYGEEGTDIICAAISSATELVVNILEQFSIDLDIEVDEEAPSVLVLILDGDNNRKKKDTVKNIVEGYRSYITDLAEAYPEFIEISTEV